ncbi:hypothetical protein XCR_4578 [Xanthomonas campestris pv. raphani 756C]|nr:hypothetical protein XCR_4578 [Xanthomonas campestris pv. raphani 756C]
MRQGPGDWGHRTLHLRGHPGEPDAKAPASQKGWTHSSWRFFLKSSAERCL